MDFAFKKTIKNVAKAEHTSVNYNRWLKPNGNENSIFWEFIAVGFIRRLKKKC